MRNASAIFFDPRRDGEPHAESAEDFTQFSADSADSADSV